MSDQSADHPPPRVEVRLPGGSTTAGRLLAWRQGRDGSWWAQAIVQIPAGAIGQVSGEDYTSVPREPAQPTARSGYVLTADTRPGQPRAAVLHAADCWSLGDLAAWTSVTPVDDEAMAAAAERFDDTTACTVCNPRP